MTFPKDLATPYSCIESVSITTSSFFLNRVFACPNLWTFTETHTHKHTHTKVWWKSVWWQLLNLIFTHSLFTDTPACTSLRSFTYHPTLSLSLFLCLCLSLSLLHTLSLSLSLSVTVCLSVSLSLSLWVLAVGQHAVYPLWSAVCLCIRCVMRFDQFSALCLETMKTWLAVLPVLQTR